MKTQTGKRLLIILQRAGLLMAMATMFEMVNHHAEVVDFVLLFVSGMMFLLLPDREREGD